MKKQPNTSPNRLIHSHSPYLLQHAYNPVDWFPWTEEALQKAQHEDKPIIVSIGYSACHWCHVMERESFENQQIAQIMNQHFVCIKVDREERPDIDAIYMDAVQAMGMQGGWPLNAFLTPQAKPFYAGTYFPPQNWVNLLLKIQEIFQQNRTELEKSAEEFANSIAVSELKKYGLEVSSTEFKREELDEMFAKLSPNFDAQFGGMQKAPKFPMPAIYEFLCQVTHLSKDSKIQEKALQHLENTLQKMAQGGIYDVIGGGFARYSVDSEWFAPHFEKMLYDNAQLIGLYANVYNLTKNSFYKEIVYQTIDFVVRELMDEKSGFYSALDADSEGVEGKYYVWTWEELQTIFQQNTSDFDLFCDFFSVQPNGNWEHQFNILYQATDTASFLLKHNLRDDIWATKLADWKKKLLVERHKRIRPGLDDKILTSWNGLMLKGLVEAYRILDEPKFLDIALENAYFLKNHLFVAISNSQTRLFHSYKNGIASITAYLEDYATVIEAFTELYQATFDLKWLKEAEKLMNYVLENFWDEVEGMFFFTDKNAEKLIARKKEIFDNVIPSSNSITAHNLFSLGILLGKDDWTKKAQEMVLLVKRILTVNVEYLANWGQLFAKMTQPTVEIVIIGEDYTFFRKKLDQYYFRNKIMIGSEFPSQALPLLKGRTAIQDKTILYVCFNKVCHLPVFSVEEAWNQIQKSSVYFDGADSII